MQPAWTNNLLTRNSNAYQYGTTVVDPAEPGRRLQ